ncbi:MAG TPA: STAS-like domain-containing protein [bacterium]|nr:STAS-like domain-containing protein [bacterium]HOL92978.1 STAS-like domain-containing protein [bacterium]HPO99330.1 STAS-like domain-containing protein [bacterium]HXK95022.1 STAS-like domain-containing protein [bacterium]
MNEPITLRINEIVGDEICVSTGDGQKVFERIATALQNKKKVDLSFLNVEILTSAFLNAAIGQLYGKFREDQIKSSLTVSDISPDDQILLERVVENAKEYYKDPERFEKALRKVMEDEDDS